MNINYLNHQRCIITALILGTLFISTCDRESDDIPTAPVTMEGLVNEGWEHYAAGEFEAAIVSFNEALERNVEPDSLGVKAYQGLGWAYSRVNRFAKSIANFNFLLSVESVRTGKNPIEQREDVVAISNPYPVSPTLYDTSGLGNWTIAVGADLYLISVFGVSSYSAQWTHKITVGTDRNKIEPGTREFKLERAPISDSTGKFLGTSLNSSLLFEVESETVTDSLVYPVAAVSDLDTTYAYDTLLTTLSEYHLDALAGLVTIKPRFWTIENLSATYKYYEKTYLVRQFGYHRISLLDELEDGSDFPVRDPPENYNGGDKYTVAGEFFNTTDGGTYLQLDAFAGMAAGFIAQGDYEAALRAARTAIFINEYLEDNDPQNYPYSRALFAGDSGFDMWNVYHLLAFSYFNLRDFINAKVCLENYMGQGDVLDPTTSIYEYDIINLLSTVQKPAGWVPPQIW